MFNRCSLTVYNSKVQNCIHNKLYYKISTSFLSKDMYFFIPTNSSLFILPDKIKVDINGKVFKWYSSPKVWRFLVHYSHLSNLVFNSCIFFFKSVGKNRYVIFSKKRVHFFILKKLLRQIRYSNLFTGRGIKYSPRCFFKKQGKISTYI